MLSGATSNLSDVGVNTVTLTVSLVDYPGIPSISKTFNV